MKPSALKLLLLLLLPVSLAFAEEELLDPEQAFAMEMQSIDDTTLRATWRIADGYYLYRSKFRFKSDDAGVALGEAVFPKGKIKHDEFFGDVEIYRGEIAVDIPYTRTAETANTITIQARSQGCADIGVCYPPHRQNRSVTLPATASAAPAITPQLGESLGFGGGQEDEVLDPDVAFRFSAIALDADTILARWEIAPGHYLYKNKFKFGVKNEKQIGLNNVTLPPGDEKDDEFFGRLEVYHDLLEVTLPLARKEATATSAELAVTYQGCSEITGICYPPQKKQLAVELPPGVGTAPAVRSTNQAGPTRVEAAPRNEPLSEQDSLAASLAGGDTLTTILLFFGLGLLLTFTPCVFPMIPILSSIIVGQGEAITTRRAFALSLAYVLAMALTYTVVGVIAGLSGANLQIFFQNPWVLSTFAVVFVLLSFSMFGFYELQLPSSWQGKLSEISNRQQGGTLTGTAIMGFLSALIVGPCVTAPLIGALIYISQTGDAVLGGLALFALSMGMGMPLLIVGTSAGKLLPRAGGWMDAVKAVFGVMLLAVAVWMLERILPGPVSLLLWALLCIGSAIYMGALEPIKESASGWARLWKGVGLALLLYGAMMLLGVASGNSDPLQPLKGIGLATAGQGQATAHLEFKKVKTVADLQREVKQAASQGKSVMLDFYADWCISCKEFEKYTFSDAAVISALDNSVTLQADVTANDEADQALMKHFDIIGPPAIIFYDSQGNERPNHRVVGYMPANEFSAHINRALRQ